MRTRGDRGASESAQVAAEVTLESHVHSVAFGTIHDGGDVLTPNGVLHYPLRLCDADTVPRQLFAVPTQIEISALVGSLGEGNTSAGDGFEQRRGACANRFDLARLG